MPVKGYFQRARVFGYLVLVISLAIIIFYLFEYFTD
jgi:inner membrane protein involved in colicin E2 resistance